MLIISAVLLLAKSVEQRPKWYLTASSTAGISKGLISFIERNSPCERCTSNVLAVSWDA